MTLWLLFIAVAAHLMPEHVANAMGHSVVAWETVGYGIEATCLWLAVYSTTKIPALWAVCAYGAFESIQRPACRLLLPMDRRLALQPGQTMCDAVGVETANLSVIAACLALTIVVQRRTEWTSGAS